MAGRRERKELDWHRSDIERKFGIRGGKYTDVNGLGAFAAAAALSGGFYIALSNLPPKIGASPAVAMLLSRGWTPYAMVFLAFFALVILFVKWRKLALQRKALGMEIVPPGVEFAITPETSRDILAALKKKVGEPWRFVLFNRIEKALQNLHNVGNVSDVSEMLRAQAESDEGTVDSSYGLVSGIVWMLPILGFIGTVSGLSGAIGGFGAALAGDASAASLKETLSPVTANLGIAFDTTFVALVLALAVQTCIILLRKREDAFMDECRDYASRNVISRLRISEASGSGRSGESVA